MKNIADIASNLVNPDLTAMYEYFNCTINFLLVSWLNLQTAFKHEVASHSAMFRTSNMWSLMTL